MLSTNRTKKFHYFFIILSNLSIKSKVFMALYVHNALKGPVKRYFPSFSIFFFNSFKNKTIEFVAFHLIKKWFLWSITASTTPHHRGRCSEGDNEFDREGPHPPSCPAYTRPLPGQKQDCPPSWARSPSQTPSNRLDS